MEALTHCPVCAAEVNPIGVEYPYSHPDHYDGISEWRFPCCDAREGRWSGRLLKDGETEKRWGGKP